jgi:NADH-quinone oxidoreductase subunit J
METVVFLIAAVVILTGALGVILSRNPVHSALMLVMTLFGVAVLFVAQEAHFLAAVQVIVYAGAIGGQRPAAAVVAVASLGLIALLAVRAAQVSTGAESVTGPLDGDGSNTVLLGRALFTDYVFAFEATGVLLVIAVVGAVVLARRPKRGADEGSRT